MQLEILGSAGSYPRPFGACSSYIVRSGSTTVLLDLGNGALSRLFPVLDPLTLSAIVISHGHSDHYADLIGLYHYLKFVTPPEKAIPVFGTQDFFAKMAQNVGNDIFHDRIFSMSSVSEHESVSIGSTVMQFYAARHSIPSLITRVNDSESTMCYGGDGDLCDNLVAACGGVDLFLGEATWLIRKDGFPTGLHLDARDLGNLSEKCAVKKLIITHVAYPTDPLDVLKIVQRFYSGDAHIAIDGDTYYF